MKNFYTDLSDKQKGTHMKGTIDIKEWLTESLPAVVNSLAESITAGHHVETGDFLGLSGRNEIYEILDRLLSVLFPGRYSQEKISIEDIRFFLNDVIGHIAYKFIHHLRDAFHFRCSRDLCDHCDCDHRADSVLVNLINILPGLRTMLLQDIESAMEGDPAAKSFDEIILSYPGIDAIATYRIAHQLYIDGVPIIPRIMAERAHSRTGIDIHPGAEIGSRFFIDHGTGVVIGETCRIGSNVKIYQGVTLGALSPFDKKGKPRKGEKRHPDIEDNVIIYANATILGGHTVIGKGSVIGGNAWIIKSVPPGSTVYKS